VQGVGWGLGCRVQGLGLPRVAPGVRVFRVKGSRFTTDEGAIVVLEAEDVS
jgi:hypothetical protein